MIAMEKLEEHGIAAEDVALLRRWFGPSLPEHVTGPGDAIKWAMSLMPWPALHPLLRRWFSEAVEGGFTLNDARLQQVLDLLVDEPDASRAVVVQKDVLQVAQTYARLFGHPVRSDGGIELIATDPRANPTVRIWTGALPVTDAVLGATLGIKGDARMVAGCFAALILLMPSTEEINPEAINRAVRDVIGALCSYVSTWTTEWK